MTGHPRLADLDSGRPRREGEQLTERRVPVERQQFRPMLATLTDKKPPIPVSGGRGDIPMSACESARCLNNHVGALAPSFRNGDLDTGARARPVMEEAVKPFASNVLRRSVRVARTA